MATQEVIRKHIKNLNSEELYQLSDAWAMSSPLYRLVCFINNSIALFMSENYKGVALFIKRAHKEILVVRSYDLVGREEFVVKYTTLCEEYLIDLMKYIRNNKLISDKDIEYYFYKD